MRTTHTFDINAIKTGYYMLFASAVFLIILSQFSNVDVEIADYYYDAQTHSFLWKNSWFAKQLMHVYVKDVIVLLALILMAYVLIDVFRPIKAITTWTRIRLRFVALAAILVPSFISGAKQISVLHCPWDVQRYGGLAPYLKLLDVMPSNVEAGHCFPAGHASTGLWLAALCVFWLPHRPRMAFFVFLAGLGIGFVLGWVQQMRGAHFLSHTLWSMWLTSAIILLMVSLGQSLLNRQN
jgi:membrane-associated PAP2 superfamily phosphatase